MKLQRLAAFGAAALAAIGLTMAAATPALAHDELRDKGLEVNSTTGELSALTFTFSNDIMAVGTEIIVTDEAGKNVVSAEPEVSGPTVRQALDTPLAAGTYQAAWRVVSSDGHPIEGNFGISIAADGAAEIVNSVEAEHAEEEHGDEGHSADGHDAEGHHDEAVEPISAPASSGMPMGGWIAIGVVLVAGIAVTAVVIARKSKKLDAVSASSTAAGDASGNAAGAAAGETSGDASGDTAEGGSTN